VGFYPVFLEMSGRRCVVVGGGAVAERRIEALLAAGAAVTVVAPALTPALAGHARDGLIAHVARHYRPGDVATHDLAFVATDDAAVSAAVAGEARERSVLVNAADDPPGCDFILPSVIRRGPLTVAVGTGGTSPALARAVREDLERHLPREYAALADLVGQVRRELRARAASPDAATWAGALADLLARARRGRSRPTRRRLLARLGAA
jgi:siroheme synthase-like protein